MNGSEDPIEALRCLLFHGDGGHIGGQNCIESMEAALQYGRHHHGIIIGGKGQWGKGNHMYITPHSIARVVTIRHDYSMQCSGEFEER